MNADGFILLAPTPIRRKLGLRLVTVVLSESNLAVITGQAVMLSAFAARQSLPFAAVPGASFRDYIQQNSKFFAWGFLLIFVATFVFVEVADRDGVSKTTVAHSHRKGVPWLDTSEMDADGWLGSMWRVQWSAKGPSIEVIENGIWLNL